MMLKPFALLLFLNSNLLCLAQSEYNINKDFTEIFLKNYQELSKPPLTNYFVILNNTVKTSFTTENPFFISALKEIENQNKINQEQALDILVSRNFKNLRQNSIWISSPKIFENEKDFFQVYNKVICPCLTSNVKKSDRLEKMLDAQKTCFAKLMLDSSLQSEIKAKGGTKTLNDLSKLQPYFAMFFYENCDILNYKFNETLTNIAVEQYSNEVTRNKISDVENLIKHFKSNRFDSVKLVFPNYALFKKEFYKLFQLTQQKDATTRFFYTGKFRSKERNIILNVMNKNIPVAQFIFVNSSNTFRTNISSLNYKKSKVNNTRDGIIEIMEVRAN